MTSLRELEKQRSEAFEAVACVQEQIDRAQRRRRVDCHHCGKKTAIGKLVYVQTYWYVEPYSCTGGDYWKAGEGRFVCPHCGWENRFWKNGATGNREWLIDLKPHFASVEKRYKKGPGDVRCCN